MPDSCNVSSEAWSTCMCPCHCRMHRSCSSAVLCPYILFMWNRPYISVNNAQETGSQNKLRQPHRRKRVSQRLCMWYYSSMDADSCWGITVLNWFGHYTIRWQQPCALWRHGPLLMQFYVSLPQLPHDRLETESVGPSVPVSHTLWSTSGLCQALCPSPLLLAARVIQAAIVFKV